VNKTPTKEVLLLFSTFLVSISGLIYELLAGTISSYFLGDSIYQFSIIIGIFMSSMGVGSWLSRYIEKDLIKNFIYLQLLIAIIGGFSSIILFFAFVVIKNYEIFLYLITILIGGMIGMEIPLIIRILKDYFLLKNNISNVFTADYIGALFASILFPIVLLPKLGILQSSLLVGGMNAFVALLSWSTFRKNLKKVVSFYIFFTFLALSIGFGVVDKFSAFVEQRLYKDPIIFAKTTPYQKIIITRKRGRVRLYINGALQFDSLDEYRYHEMLIHPAMIMAKSHQRVLILGGGDGLALREILKYKDTKKITLVDLDGAVTDIFRSNKFLRRLNKDSLNSPKVEIINQDAWKYIENSQELFDLIVVDLPDPNNVSLSRLYSKKFYTILKDHLSKFGVMVVQSTSPLFAKKAFWSIHQTIKSTSLKTKPYHIYIPSFGEWGFVLASWQNWRFEFDKLPKDIKFFDKEELKAALKFPKDMQKVDVKINTLFTHPLLKYYQEGWAYWYE
jgi:spermidine synthase